MMIKRLFVAAVTAILVGSLPLYVYSQSVIAIKGGTVITMAGQTLESGIVLIKDGKIEEVGDAVKIPDGAKIIDASGKYVFYRSCQI